MARAATSGSELVEQIMEEEYAALRDAVGAEAFESGHWADARRLFAESALSEEFPDLLTLPAYAVVLASGD